MFGAAGQEQAAILMAEDDRDSNVRSALAGEGEAGDVLEATATVAEATGLAGAVAQVVELGTTRIRAAEDFELGDHRGVDRELALDADFLDDAADGDHLVDAAALAGDENAVEDLDAFLVALDDADVDVDGVPNIHAGDVGLEGVEGLEDGGLGVGLLGHGWVSREKLGGEDRRGGGGFLTGLKVRKVGGGEFEHLGGGEKPDWRGCGGGFCGRGRDVGWARCASKGPQGTVPHGHTRHLESLGRWGGGHVLEQVGASIAGALEHLLKTPLGHLLVIAADEDIGDGHSHPFAGAGVVGAVEEAHGRVGLGVWVGLGGGTGLWGCDRRKAVAVGGTFMAEGPGKEADDGVHEDHGREFAAGEDVVAEAEFEGGEFLDDAFIDALVMAGDEEEAGFGGKVFDDGLGERAALWREEDAGSGAGVHGLDRVNGVPERLAGHDHAGPAAEGAVVGLLMLVGGVVPDVVGVPFDEAAFTRTRGDGEAERGGGLGREYFGEGGEDVEAEGQGQSSKGADCQISKLAREW